VKVYELARELGISSKELITKLKALNMPVSSHMNVLKEEAIERIKKELSPALEPPQLHKKKADKPLETDAQAAKEKIKPEEKELTVDFPLTVKDLAIKLRQKPSVVIKFLMSKGIMAGINQSLEQEQAMLVAGEFGFKLKKALTQEEQLLKIHQQSVQFAPLKPRWPVVTFMGHVDHGKTSLLDTIRKSKVAEDEHGGITQHIGAYEVNLPSGHISFVDTPGHEAFTAMRARGARITDIVVLVVAADDGVMPQTVEAIDHAREAGVPIIVAINKIDKPSADIDKVKKQLSQLNLAAEDWGGKTITVCVSAKTGEGINDLLEMILLEAQMLELKANYQCLAQGVVIEARLSKGKGPVAILLVQNGILHLNDNIIIGRFYGKARALFDTFGHPIKEASPSKPVKILGLSGVPQAGEKFFVVADEKQARQIAMMRQQKEKLAQLKTARRISLDDLYTQIKEGKIKELKVIVKADTSGSLEAVKDSLEAFDVSQIRIMIIHQGIGAINASDAILAAASDALLLGFHVRPDEKAKEIISREGLDVRTYNVIYELTRDLKAALEGMLEPKIKKVFLGRLQVRKVFKVSGAGTVAGCFVAKGKVLRNAYVMLRRNAQVVFEGKISSLKRFKNDAREVTEGYECGVSLSGFEDIRQDDVIEVYQIEKIARKL
jgi:translation initiation factor IF-2